MSQGITVEAVRLALGMNRLRADVAGRNIAQAATPGAQAMRVDFAAVQQALDAAAAGSATRAELADAMRRLGDAPKQPGGGVELDAEVAEMVVASTQYQALTEVLGRHFALMRLATSGRP